MGTVGIKARRRRALALIVIALALSAGFTGWRLTRAAAAGVDGKDALLGAQRALGDRDSAAARKRLLAAEAAFGRMDSELDGLGPLGPVLRAIPLVRVQVRGAEAFRRSGTLLAGAGRDLVDAADRVRAPGEVKTTTARLLPHLRTLQPALRSGAHRAEAAVAEVRRLDGYRLLGPLASARSQLLEQLTPVARQAREAQRGAAALETFFGAKGPRRYLVFSQNPEEPRPTGGFIGTYSILSTNADGLRLESSDSISPWLARHDAVRVKREQAGGPFAYGNSELPSLANVNFIADWTVAGRLAAQLWTEAGEQPVDGVMGITPAFLAQVLRVTGPVTVPAYDETVTAQNLVARLTAHTTTVAAGREANTARKAFASEVARLVLNRILDVPAADWEKLAAALARGFDRREAMVWSTDADVQRALQQRRWDGTLPRGTGDFFYNSEFSYAAKNGRRLQRKFVHYVVLRKDGSARVTTTLTLRNNQPRDALNLTALTYVTLYGPTGAKLDGASDDGATVERVIAGHPAAAWFTEPPPLGEAKVKIVWEVPQLARELGDGVWSYDLRWMRVIDHTGDTLQLRVDLPRGWAWTGSKPPTTVSLDDDLVGSWRYSD